MNSKIVIAVWGGIFSICVFIAGFVSALYVNHSAVKSSYAQEHVNTGRAMLHTLQQLNSNEVEQAKLFLQEQISSKVLQTNSARLPPTSQRDIVLIEEFYKEVLAFQDLQANTQDKNANANLAYKMSAAKNILDKFAAQSESKDL